MVDEGVTVDDAERAAIQAADGGAGVIEAAAEQLREEVLTLNPLGTRHAELNDQIRVLSAERDAVASEYQDRYRQLAGGQFMNATLRQLGMGESLDGSPTIKRRKRSAASRGGEGTMDGPADAAS
jgi:hypothetical protein